MQYGTGNGLTRKPLSISNTHIDMPQFVRALAALAIR